MEERELYHLPEIWKDTGYSVLELEYCEDRMLQIDDRETTTLPVTTGIVTTIHFDERFIKSHLNVLILSSCPMDTKYGITFEEVFNIFSCMAFDGDTKERVVGVGYDLYFMYYSKTDLKGDPRRVESDFCERVAFETYLDPFSEAVIKFDIVISMQEYFHDNTLFVGDTQYYKPSIDKKNTIVIRLNPYRLNVINRDGKINLGDFFHDFRENEYALWGSNFQDIELIEKMRKEARRLFNDLASIDGTQMQNLLFLLTHELCHAIDYKMVNDRFNPDQMAGSNQCIYAFAAYCDNLASYSGNIECDEYRKVKWVLMNDKAAFFNTYQVR
ncbi:hypothetical protein [Agathobaculum sp.]|uniref:hypothetical protein n=1 Tax=Agathobaculum sp. TaxID=2048138 RepID=UPI002A837525|nr:hypothetical protein [Agathobaculum sp.]MDY3619325.1 hypothetical protein [Agathobaculum sp.]